MNKIAHIDLETNKVVNIAVGDEINPIPGILCIFSEIAEIGDTYNLGNFTKPAAEPLTQEQIQRQAEIELYKTDIVASRCFKAGVAFPDDWKSYVAELRNVVKGNSSVLPPPPLGEDGKPKYPQGTD